MNMTKEDLIVFANDILNSVNIQCNLDGVENYDALVISIAKKISKRFGLGIDFTEQE